MRAESVFQQRMRAAGLSLWELGDLLGIHPHFFHYSKERIDDLPVRVVVDLAQRLDMHPADLVPELDSVLGNERGRPQSEPTGDVDEDALVVLTALANSVEPLTQEELATALDWPLARVAEALVHAEEHPRLAGPVALRRTEHDTYSLDARLDRISGEQRQRLARAQLYRRPLTAEQANMLLAALSLRGDPPEYLRRRAADPDVEWDLKRLGLIYTDNGPHRPQASDDLRFSLRYFNKPDGH